MPSYKVLRAASYRIEDIYAYSFDQWGETQARAYVSGLFACFDQIAEGSVQSYPIAAEFGVRGFFTRYEKHFIFWHQLSDGTIGIASVLDQRMDLGNRLIEDAVRNE